MYRMDILRQVIRLQILTSGIRTNWLQLTVHLPLNALQDEASIKQYGYLYDIHAALSGKAVTPENCYDFEGAQGICPKGWHIPTRAEYFSLVGNSTKDVDGNSLENGKDALFYDTAYDGGKIPTLNEAKFNYQSREYVCQPVIQPSPNIRQRQ